MKLHSSDQVVKDCRFDSQKLSRCNKIRNPHQAPSYSFSWFSAARQNKLYIVHRRDKIFLPPPHNPFRSFFDTQSSRSSFKHKGQITFKSTAFSGASSHFHPSRNVWPALKRNVSHAVVGLFSHVGVFVTRQSPTHKELTVCEADSRLCRLRQFVAYGQNSNIVLDVNVLKRILIYSLVFNSATWNTTCVLRHEWVSSPVVLTAFINKGHFIDSCLWLWIIITRTQNLVLWLNG